VGLGVLVLATIALCTRLKVPKTYIYDETYQVFTAHRLITGDRNVWNPDATRADLPAFSKADATHSSRYEWTHPPGAKLLIATGLLIGGFKPSAARAGSVVFGILMLVAIWRIGARLHGEGVGVVAMALCATDGMWFVLSRTAMADIYLAAVVAWGSYSLLRWWTTLRARWLLVAGATFGVSVAIKWSGLPLLLGAALVTAARFVWEARGERPIGKRDVVTWLAAFVVAPMAIYLAAYLPFFVAGYDWADFVALHERMIRYHSNLGIRNPHNSPWWQWPVMIRSVWFYLDVQPDGAYRLIYALGNPLVWWGFVPALAVAGARLWRARGRDLGAMTVLGGFCGVWLPWSIVDRETYTQYLLPAVPFGILGIVIALQRLGRRWVIPSYLALCVLAFVWFYPIWTAVPVDPESFRGSRWFWLASWR
jgi:dolichyl-phosphate-mannose--protein O-mannosyl transferase